MGKMRVWLVVVMALFVWASPLNRGAFVCAQDGNIPTMSNSSMEEPFEPLPPGWPSEIKDIHMRGAACEDGYGKDGAKAHALPGDVLLPVAGFVPQGLDSQYLAVRTLPFLIRRDVREAVFASDPDVSGRYEVRLLLTDDGATKIREFTASAAGTCIALVGDGKVLWVAQIADPLEDDVFVLSGAFSSLQAIGIVDAFNRK